ncbi:MAG: exo-alpha-sialidase [Acidobacteria bacterium]|nr:exo-alpha-sialidase [Acidobacteriota bacterium]MBI3424675.1 exo-alpha-sialidase [Acidobacteriota bacterium]
MKNKLLLGLGSLALIAGCLRIINSTAAARTAAPFHTAELIFPLEHWHNHASSIIECSNGDLLVCWFHGSGERTADDVIVEGARLRKGARQWSPRFTLADTPGYPDTNCTMFIDPRGRLWLLWPTILANQWESALMKYKIASRYSADGPPQWDWQEVLHVTPGPEFEATVNRVLAEWEKQQPISPEAPRETLQAYMARIRKLASDKLSRRLGWMTRAHPFVLTLPTGKQRLIVPLYSDGFSFSLMAISDDWGQTWHTSTPLIGGGNIQPSIVRKQDGSLYTLMRDNGPAPKRLQQSTSRDHGETWSPVTDSELPNPGSGAEVIGLRNGHWALIYNDTERERNSLTVALSDDEGKTWKWKRQLEYDPPGPEAGRFHYPSIIQARDSSLHASYSYHLNRKEVELDAEEKQRRKAIKHAHFNEEWVMSK